MEYVKSLIRYSSVEAHGISLPSEKDQKWHLCHCQPTCSNTECRIVRRTDDIMTSKPKRENKNQVIQKIAKCLHEGVI